MSQEPLFPDLLAADPAADLPRVRCRACDAPMVWVPSVHGRAIPLDPAPVPAGSIVLTRDAAGQLVAEVPGRATVIPAGTPRYQSHFVTCPEAGRFRKRDRRRR